MLSKNALNWLKKEESKKKKNENKYAEYFQNTFITETHYSRQFLLAVKDWMFTCELLANVEMVVCEHQLIRL